MAAEIKLIFTPEEGGDRAPLAIDDAKRILGSGAAAAGPAASGPNRKGWIRRIERGGYLVVPSRAGMSGRWAEEPWAIVPHPAREYYAWFLAAMRHWEMTGRAPYTVFVATPERRKSESPEFGDQRREFVTPSGKKLLGFTEERTDRTKFSISSREKKIVDCPARPECRGGIPEVARAMRNARREVDWNKASESAGMTEINAVLQRLGCLLSVPEIEDAIAKSAVAVVRRHPNQHLDPGAAKKRIGSSREYGLPVNRTVEELLGRIDCR